MSGSLQVPIPIKEKEGEQWLILNVLGDKGIIRAAKIEKGKSQVLDWDGHHCDIANLRGSIRYKPKSWKIL